MGGRGSWSRNGRTFDTKGGLLLGGGIKILPPENSSRDLQVKYSRSGFGALYGGDDVTNSVLGTYASQLGELDKKFGAIRKSDTVDVVVVSQSGTDSIAAVGFNPLNTADQMLYLNSAYLGRISDATATTRKNTASGWAAKNSGDLRANAYYSVTHEYGHILHNQMYASAKAKGYTGSRNEYIESLNDEIKTIARDRYGVKHATSVSEYGNSNGRELFAETFASSQLGGNTGMAKAMRYWLDQQLEAGRIG